MASESEKVPAPSKGEGATSRSVDRFRSLPEPDGSDVTESGTTVLVAFGANVLVATAKSVAAVTTGSPSMLAEAAHSWADAGNEVFLLVANRRSRRPADSSHPLGYGREAYIWSLFAAMGLFIAVLQALQDAPEVDRVTYLRLEVVGPRMVSIIGHLQLTGDDGQADLAVRLRTLEARMCASPAVAGAVLSLSED